MRRMISTFLVSLAAAVALGGCDVPPSAPPAALVTMSAPHCPVGVAAPIALKTIQAALVAVGDETDLDRSICSSTGPRSQQVLGLLTSENTLCTVYMAAPPRQNGRPHTRFEGPNYSGKAYVVAFGNVDCSVYDRGSARDAVVRALRAIFRRLGATGPVVSSDPSA